MILINFFILIAFLNFVIFWIAEKISSHHVLHFGDGGAHELFAVFSGSGCFDGFRNSVQKTIVRSFQSVREKNWIFKP